MSTGALLSFRLHDSGQQYVVQPLLLHHLFLLPALRPFIEAISDINPLKDSVSCFLLPYLPALAMVVFWFAMPTFLTPLVPHHNPMSSSFRRIYFLVAVLRENRTKSARPFPPSPFAHPASPSSHGCRPIPSRTSFYFLRVPFSQATTLHQPDAIFGPSPRAQPTNKKRDLASRLSTPDPF